MENEYRWYRLKKGDAKMTKSDIKSFIEEMEKIGALDKKESSFFNHQTPEAVELFLKFIEERKNRE